MSRMRTFDFEHALKIAPDIIGELRVYITPGRSGHADRPPKGFNARAPLSASPVDDADNLYAYLREHAAALAETIGTTPPSTIGWAPNGDRGLPAGTTPEKAFSESRKLSRFLTHQIHYLTDEDLRQAIEQDIINTVHKLEAKYPTTAPPEKVKARCGNCQKLTVHKHPARSFGADEHFICRSCGCWHTEREVIERMAARERELKAKRRTAA